MCGVVRLVAHEAAVWHAPIAVESAGVPLNAKDAKVRNGREGTVMHCEVRHGPRRLQMLEIR